jgi:hypothetical protein
MGVHCHLEGQILLGCWGFYLPFINYKENNAFKFFLYIFLSKNKIPHIHMHLSWKPLTICQPTCARKPNVIIGHTHTLIKNLSTKL